jgi:hypothetical protein
MHCLVAFPAKRNQIGLGIVTECAASLQVVNIEVSETATSLTAPVVARQDIFTQLRIRDGRYSNSRPLLRDGVAHLAFSLGSDGSYVAAAHPMDAVDLRFCFDSAVSNAAPARKSAQIISRE